MISLYEKLFSFPQNKLCNCQKNMECPLEGQCMCTGVVYQASVTRNDTGNVEHYVGLTGGDFKNQI